MAMDYGVASDQLMWSGQEQMPSDEFWGASMTSPQYPHMQQGPVQEVPDFYQQPMVPQSQELLLPVIPQHYSETQSMMQMGPMTPHGQMAPHCQMGPMTPQEHMTPHSQMGPMTPQMPLMTPQMPLMQVHLPQMQNCGERSPAECMAMVMPGAAAQFPGSNAPIDKDLMALQLKAAAELQQCYED